MTTPKQTPEEEHTPAEVPQVIQPGHGAALFRLPPELLKRKPGAPWTEEETAALTAYIRKAYGPMLEQLTRDYKQRDDRQAVLELLPDWAYDRLDRNRPFTPDDAAALRAYFFEHHPDLAARIDPMRVIGGFTYGRWFESNHGRPGPTLPPRQRGGQSTGE
jgi:hypothetical protein